MILNSRQREILNILKKEKRISVLSLSQRLYVCEMTIRRDLKEMEQNNLLKRYHGGAVIEQAENNYPVSLRKHLHESSKKNLALKGAKHLKDGQCVFIDSSSTCMYIITHIKNFKNMRLVTNSIQTLLMAAQFHIPCMITGGEYYEKDMCMVGAGAENFIRDINFDIAFFSSQAISDDGIISDYDEAQTQIRRVVMANTEKSVFLFEEAKLHKKCAFTLCRSEDATEIIF